MPLMISNYLALEILRHDCAHFLLQTVKELYPSVQVVIGPTIEYDFYYDNNVLRR